MLIVGAWVRAPSIGRLEPLRAVYLVARSAAAYAACLGSCSRQKRWTTRASDASRSRLGPAALADCGGLLAAVVLR